MLMSRAIYTFISRFDASLSTVADFDNIVASLRAFSTFLDALRPSTSVARLREHEILARHFIALDAAPFRRIALRHRPLMGENTLSALPVGDIFSGPISFAAATSLFHVDTLLI